MQIQLIAMDLDGTALQNDHHSFSPRLLAALEEAHRRGVAIVPVTGRQFSLLPPPLKCHPVWENLVVVCNGGQIRRLGTGQRLYGLDIPRPALDQLLDLARTYRIPIEFSVDGKLHLTTASYDMQRGLDELCFHRDTILAQHGVVVDSLIPLRDGAKVEKVNLPYIRPEARKDVEAALKSVPVSAVWASSYSFEITHPDATKGNGLVQVCRLLGVSPERAMALGDSGNDESMLRLAGLGVAMGNAPEAVQAAADAVTDPNDQDGAAKAIEQYVLK